MFYLSERKTESMMYDQLRLIQYASANQVYYRRVMSPII